MTNSKKTKTHDSDITSKPKAGTWDTAYTVVKAGLSAIPVAILKALELSHNNNIRINDAIIAAHASDLNVGFL